MVCSPGFILAIADPHEYGTAAHSCFSCLPNKRTARFYCQQYRRLQTLVTKLREEIADLKGVSGRQGQEIIFLREQWASADDRERKLMQALEAEGLDGSAILRATPESDWDSVVDEELSE